MHVIFRQSNTPGCNNFDGLEACGSASCANQTGMTAKKAQLVVGSCGRACCAMSGGQRDSTSGSNRRATNVRVEQQASLRSATHSASPCSTAAPAALQVTAWCGKQRKYMLIQA